MTKAAILIEPGQPLSIETVQIADCGPHEVRIRTAACGLCHSDLHFIDGAYPHPLPAIPGHEAAGIVEAVGSEVRTVKVGDAVVTCLSAFCGHCEFCVSGRMSLCMGGDTRRPAGAAPRITRPDGSMVNQMLNLSAFAETMLVHEHACVAIDPDMPLDRAAVIGCAVTTGAGTIFNACKVTPGETVADPVPEKRALAMKLGATDVVDAMDGDAAKQILEISKGGVDHAIEAVGRPASASLAVASLRRGGTATILGMMPLTEKVGLSAMDLLSGKKLQGAIMGGNRFPVDIPRLVDFYLRGLLDLDSIVAETIPLERINDGFDKMKKGDAARSVIVFDQ